MPKENQNGPRNEYVLIMCFCNGRGNWLRWRKSNSELLQVKIILLIYRNYLGYNGIVCYILSNISLFT